MGSELTDLPMETVRALTDSWYAPLGLLMRQPGTPVKASDVRALATEVLAQRGIIKEVRAITGWCMTGHNQPRMVQALIAVLDGADWRAKEER